MVSNKTMELSWPMRGVVRRESLRSTPDSRGPWPSPWAVNCRVDDPLDRRLRGGSRPGLTKLVADDMGTTIADMASVNVASASGGASEVLFVLVDSTVKTVEGGTTTTPVAYLTNESGDTLTDESDEPITVSSADAPASGFLVVGQQHVFAVTTSAIVKMDPKTGQVDNLAASAGTIPTNCTFGAVYRDRLCLSGEDNAIYMSKLGDYTDWNYGAYFEDPGRALAFQLSLSNEVGPLPTAMIPHKDINLIVGSKRSLWVVQGDPAADGVLRRISEHVGIISSRAWCQIEDTICFLAEDGIYRVNADGSNLTPLSRETVPAELLNVDTSSVTISMGYEHDRRAVHIFLRTSGGSDNHWVYELVTESWWLERLQNDHSPLVCTPHDGKLLLAGGDGHIRYIGGSNDDGSNIQSHVAIGPLRLATENRFGRLLHLYGITAAGSATVTWRIVLGDSAEQAADNAKTAIELALSGGDFSSYIHSSGTWSAGVNNRTYPRARSKWMILWLSASGQWAYEGASLESVMSGRWR